MDNPFSKIDERLEKVESLLFELTRETLPKLFQQQDKQATKVVDLNGLVAARPIVGSKSTIYKKVHQGLIPHSKRGKKLYFNLEEIDTWLLEAKVKTTAEMVAETENYLQRGKDGKQ